MKPLKAPLHRPINTQESPSSLGWRFFSYHRTYNKTTLYTYRALYIMPYYSSVSNVTSNGWRSTILRYLTLG